MAFSPMKYMLDVEMVEPATKTLERLKAESQAPDRGLGPLPEGKNEVPQIPTGRPKAVGLGAVRSFYGSVKWAWPSWVPAGHLTLFVGPQGSGKSFFMCHLIASLWRGDPWPDGQPFDAPRGPVLLVDTEEMRGAYAERLAALGIEEDEALVIPSPDGSPTYIPRLPKDLPMVRELATLHKCAAIVVDSLGGAHALDENSAAMRSLLQGLSATATTLQMPVVLVHHLRKRSAIEDLAPTLDRIRGSSAISQYCRSVIALYRLDERDQTAPVKVESLKSSFCAPPEPFGFTIGEKGLTFHDAPEEDRPSTAIDRAVDFLRAALESRPEKFAVLCERAEEAGVSKNSLYRARERLGVVAKDGYWGLPDRGNFTSSYSP